MAYIVKKNSRACLVNFGEMGFWVLTKINNTRTRLFAGGTLDKGLRVFNWYANTPKEN